MSTASTSNRKGGSYVGAGAATGALIGTYVFPAVGTMVGAGVGAILGGIAGSLDIGHSAKSQAKKARRIAMEREQNAQDAAYLQMIRQARIARAGSLAASTNYGISSSSLATSALSSIGSQSQYSVQYTANDQRLLSLYNRYMKKAGDYAKSAQTTLATGQLVGTMFMVGGAFAGASSASSGVASELAKQGIVEGSTAMATAQSTAYSAALKTGLENAVLMNQITSPIVTGVNQYNQI